MSTIKADNETDIVRYQCEQCGAEMTREGLCIDCLPGPVTDDLGELWHQANGCG